MNVWLIILFALASNFENGPDSVLFCPPKILRKTHRNHHTFVPTWTTANRSPKITANFSSEKIIKQILRVTISMHDSQFLQIKIIILQANTSCACVWDRVSEWEWADNLISIFGGQFSIAYIALSARHAFSFQSSVYSFFLVGCFFISSWLHTHTYIFYVAFLPLITLWLYAMIAN